MAGFAAAAALVYRVVYGVSWLASLAMGIAGAAILPLVNGHLIR